MDGLQTPVCSVLILKLASSLPPFLPVRCWPAHPLVFRVPNPHLRQVDFTSAICMGGRSVRPGSVTAIAGNHFGITDWILHQLYIKTPLFDMEYDK